MDCQCCNKKPARIRICDVEGNAVEEQINVCPDCFALIKRYMFDNTKPLMSTPTVIQEVQVLLGAGGKSLAMTEQPGAIAPFSKSTESVPTCPDCGMTLSEFRARGRFGCPSDYVAFAEHLDPLFERIHDVQPARHEGRLPENASGDDEPPGRKQQLKDLKKRLDKAVNEEDFELAAKLRDEIAELKQETSS